jgi:hypothetical protein
MKSQHFTSEDYAAMAVAAEELARISTNPLRARNNKALSERYRALSLRSAATVRVRPTETV